MFHNRKENINPAVVGFIKLHTPKSNILVDIQESLNNIRTHTHVRASHICKDVAWHALSVFELFLSSNIAWDLGSIIRMQKLENME